MVLFIQLIINFLKKLFGGGSSTPSLPTGQQTAGSVPSAGGFAAAAAEEEEEDLPYAQQEWKELQELIARVEGGGVDLCGVNWQDPVSFWQREFAIEQAQAEGKTRQQGILEAGYPNEDHHDLLMSYVTAKWCRLGVDEDGEQAVIQDDQYQNAMIQARMGQMQGQMAAKAAADPSLLEPVNGVTLEQYASAAAACAGLGEGATAQHVAEALARVGLDRPTYDAAAAGWQAKMQADTSYVLVQKYGEAFAAAQGQAGGFSRDPNAQTGPEPCTFEQFVEIMVAQEAWAQQGMDVNAQLRAVFNMNAAGYSMFASYWSPKMGTDVARMRQYDQLRTQYLAKYSGAGMDDDLSL